MLLILAGIGVMITAFWMLMKDLHKLAAMAAFVSFILGAVMVAEGIG